MATTAGPQTLAQALILFHKDAPKIALDGENPHFKSKFPTLAGIMEAVRPALAKNDLAIAQLPTTVEGQQALRTMLLHSSGESLEDTMLLSVDKPGPQAHGSALSYARRYAVLAILGLVGDEDDDANAAQGASEKKPAQKPAAKPSENGFGPEQVKRLDLVKAALLDAGAITSEQLANATSSGAELLAKLELFAKTKGVVV